jgi:hypothetical protein
VVWSFRAVTTVPAFFCTVAEVRVMEAAASPVPQTQSSPSGGSLGVVTTRLEGSLQLPVKDRSDYFILKFLTLFHWFFFFCCFLL